MSFRVAEEDGVLEDYEEEDQVHQLEIVVDENASTPSRKRTSIAKGPIPQKVPKTSLFGSFFESLRSMIGLSTTDDEEDVVEVPSASSRRQVLHSTHQNSSADSIVFEGVVEKPDVIATTPAKNVVLPKAWPPAAEKVNQDETQEEDSESTEDEVEVIGEVTISPKSLLTNERRSVEEIMTAVTGAEVVTVDDSGSDSISILSARNGETCQSPGPDDSVSRQNTPRSFYEHSEFRTPRDSFSRRRPHRKQERSIPRVGANTPRSSRLEKGQKRRESLYFTPSKEMVAETGGHLIYAESLRRSSVALRASGGGGYTPKSTSIFKKSHTSSVNPIEYLHRVRVAMKKVPVAKETPVVTLDDDSSSQSSGSSVQILNDEVEILGTRHVEPTSTYLTSARARVDDLLATYALTSQKDREVFEKVEMYKREKTLWKRQEEELNGQHKQLADNRKKNDVSIEDEIRERLELMGIVTPKPKPKEKDEFPELPAEGKELVKRAWARLSPAEQFCEAFEIKITRKDLLTLSGLQWLNDEIINFYMQLICQRSIQENLPKVYAFNTFFYPTVSTRGHAGVKRWTRKVDIFSYEIILVPVHVNKIHWCMAVIDLGKKRIDYFDSMLGTNDKCLMDLEKYLKDESRDKKKCELDMSGWMFTNRQDCPRQTNGSDCGVFSCRVAEYCSRRRPFNFSQEHMPYYRERMVYEIVNKKLL